MRYNSLGDNAHLAMQYDAIALPNILPTVSRYLPWTDSAIRPAAIQILLNEIFINRRKSVLELGSGISTVFIAAMLERFGGHLVTVEHTPEWIEVVKSWLTQKERSVVTFVHAPIRKAKYKEHSVEWYHAGAIDEALKTRPPIDMVVVDGPPAYQTDPCYNRGPVLAHIQDCLHSSAALFLDDINRPGEREIAADWSESLAVQPRILSVESGLAYWRIGAGHNISQ